MTKIKIGRIFGALDISDEVKRAVREDTVAVLMSSMDGGMPKEEAMRLAVSTGDVEVMRAVANREQNT